MDTVVYRFFTEYGIDMFRIMLWVGVGITGLFVLVFAKSGLENERKEFIECFGACAVAVILMLMFLYKLGAISAGGL